MHIERFESLYQKKFTYHCTNTLTIEQNACQKYSLFSTPSLLAVHTIQKKKCVH